MSKHKTVQVEIEPGDFREIDCMIAPLIKRLWELELYTGLSCEDNFPDKYIWVQFFDGVIASLFLQAVADYSDREYYNRITGEWDDPEEEFLWKYSTGVDDWGIGYDYDEEDNIVEEHAPIKNNFSFPISVRFPQKDLNKVMTMLNKTTKEEVWK